MTKGQSFQATGQERHMLKHSERKPDEGFPARQSEAAIDKVSETLNDRVVGPCLDDAGRNNLVHTFRYGA